MIVWIVGMLTIVMVEAISFIEKPILILYFSFHFTSNEIASTCD